MKTLFVAAALCVLPVLGPARAEVLDMSAVTCHQLAPGQEGDSTALMGWLHGYLAGKSGNATLDLEASEAAIDRAIQFCTENPDARAVDALDRAAAGEAI